MMTAKLPADPTYSDFYRAVLAHLGITPNVGNMRAFGAITIIEGRNHYWNPMNWTLPEGYPKFNSTGVREYPDADTGARLTASNLLGNSRWRPFVASLHNPPDRFPPLHAIAAIYAEWGSHPDFLGVDGDDAKALLLERMPK